MAELLPPGANQNQEPAEPGDAQRAAAEAEAQKYNRKESLSDELISGAENPEELYIGLRLLEKQMEEAFIPPNLQERYSPPRHLSAMYERREMLRLSIDDLIKKGWIKKDTYNPTTGEAELKDDRFAALALKKEIEETKDQKGRPTGRVIHYFFGKAETQTIKGPDGKDVVTFIAKDPEGKDVKYYSKERAALAEAYNEAANELSARDIVGEQLGLRLSIDIRDSLETMVQYLHGGRMPKLKPIHLHTLFNLSSLEEMGKNPEKENHLLGDKVEEGLFLNLVMLNSGSKQKMEEFLERPGAQGLIHRFAERQGMTDDVWTKKYIGDVKYWVDDSLRELTDYKDAKGDDMKATWRIEAEKGKLGMEGGRGELTKYANIAAWGGNPSEFSEEKEKEFIEKTMGDIIGGEESVQAAWLACAIMRATGTYASEGYVALSNGKTLLPLGEGRFISGDDTGKFHVYMFNMKEGLKGRTSGLKDMIGKIPDMAMNLFDWAQVEVVQKRSDGTVVKDKDGKEKKVQKSIWDAWLGAPGGKRKIDILTGKPTQDATKITEGQGYTRLGDLNFNSLEREFHATFSIMQWLMGNERGPTGVLIDALNIDDLKPEDFKLNPQKKRWKYIDIVMNPIVLTKGSRDLYDLGVETKEEVKTYDLTAEGSVKFNTRMVTTKSIETIKKRYFRALQDARTVSYDYMVGIIPKTTLIFNRGTGKPFFEVPNAILNELFADEAMRENPKDEQGVIDHYIDDLARLERLGIEWKGVAAIRASSQARIDKKLPAGRVIGKTQI
ncbi:MAG: hypothetical protein HYV90_01105 [Candidatus Woesebacteria bacterium]|nr:MAG: hypothetical protein HYV90_01105 [Candidatus Woesebacteria bacterium]